MLIQARIFHSLVKNKTFHHIANGNIDWYYIKRWLNYNPTDAPISKKLSKHQGLKSKNPVLSTQLQISFNDITQNYILQDPKRLKQTQILIDLLIKHTSSFNFDIKDRVSASPLFNLPLLEGIPIALDC
ncbi:hypothetical protein RhiirA1_476902 [Rhizophagus irregularis]|uniref:Uncharacterized protein n=1 Tax=Rhizophagus irregularis TaxID=588596 RepID=A0A2N0QUE3_9GLOM|nr:hypothetical protein RhiirA1_476902 [Rhizophagus irregularis]